MTTESWLESKSTSPTITRELTLLSNISCKGPSNWSLGKCADLNENTSMELLILCDTVELRPVKIDLRQIQIPLRLHEILLPENFQKIF